jgi:hypothetical protein
MAVKAYCNDPLLLLNKIKAGIRSGSIQTWTLDKDGDFSHSPMQWMNKGWFRPVIGQGVLLFNILGPTQAVMSKETYGVYHGRFIEMLLTHFDTDCSSATATALPVSGDILGGP